VQVREYLLRREQPFGAPPDVVFAFFADARNLEAITPPLLRFRVLTPRVIELRPGARIEYRLRLHRVPIRWLTEIRVWEPPRRFADIQIRGPFAHWHHSHEFTPAPAGGTLTTDTVAYAIGRGPLGALAHELFVRRDLHTIFDFRARAVTAALGPLA